MDSNTTALPGSDKPIPLSRLDTFIPPSRIEFLYGRLNDLAYAFPYLYYILAIRRYFLRIAYFIWRYKYPQSGWIGVTRRSLFNRPVFVRFTSMSPNLVKYLNDRGSCFQPAYIQHSDLDLSNRSTFRRPYIWFSTSGAFLHIASKPRRGGFRIKYLRIAKKARCRGRAAGIPPLVSVV